jgi:hypothetical protein
MDELPLEASEEMVFLFTRVCHAMYLPNAPPSVVCHAVYLPNALPSSSPLAIMDSIKRPKRNPTKDLVDHLHALLSQSQSNSFVDVEPVFALMMKDILLHTRFGKRFHLHPLFSPEIPACIPLDVANLEGHDKVFPHQTPLSL